MWSPVGSEAFSDPWADHRDGAPSSSPSPPPLLPPPPPPPASVAVAEKKNGGGGDGRTLTEKTAMPTTTTTTTTGTLPQSYVKGSTVLDSRRANVSGPAPAQVPAPASTPSSSSATAVKTDSAKAPTASTNRNYDERIDDTHTTEGTKEMGRRQVGEAAMGEANQIQMRQGETDNDDADDDDDANPAATTATSSLSYLGLRNRGLPSYSAREQLITGGGVGTGGGRGLKYRPAANATKTSAAAATVVVVAAATVASNAASTPASDSAPSAARVPQHVANDNVCLSAPLSPVSPSAAAGGTGGGANEGSDHSESIEVRMGPPSYFTPSRHWQQQQQQQQTPSQPGKAAGTTMTTTTTSPTKRIEAERRMKRSPVPNSSYALSPRSPTDRTYSSIHATSPRSNSAFRSPPRTSATNANSTAASHPTPTLASPSSFESDLISSSPVDAIALSRWGPERTVLELRRRLDDVQTQSSSAKTALAKSDAVILELRRTVRELRTDAARYQAERDDARRIGRECRAQYDRSRKEWDEERACMTQRERQLLDMQSHMASMAAAAAAASSSSSPPSSGGGGGGGGKKGVGVGGGSKVIQQAVGEMQLKLDRAHAQILTCDMKLRERDDAYASVLSDLERRMSEALKRRDDELNELRAECDDLTLRLCDRDEALTIADERVQSIQRRLDNTSRELMATRRELDRAGEELDGAREELDGARVELKRREDELDGARDGLSATKRRHEADGDDVAFARRQAEDLEAKLRVAKEELASREKELDVFRRNATTCSCGGNIGSNSDGASNGGGNRPRSHQHDRGDRPDADDTDPAGTYRRYVPTASSPLSSTPAEDETVRDLRIQVDVLRARMLEARQDALDSNGQDGLSDEDSGGKGDGSSKRRIRELELELEETALKYGEAELELAEERLRLAQYERRFREAQAELDKWREREHLLDNDKNEERGGHKAVGGDAAGRNGVKKNGAGEDSGDNVKNRKEAEEDNAKTKTLENYNRVLSERDALRSERDALIRERDELTKDCLSKLQDNHERIRTVLCSPDLMKAAEAVDAALAASGARAVVDGNAGGGGTGAAAAPAPATGGGATPLQVHIDKTSSKTTPRLKRWKRSASAGGGNDDDENDDDDEGDQSATHDESFLTRASDYRYLAEELRDQLDVAKEEIHNLRAQLRLLRETCDRRRAEKEELERCRRPEDVYDEVMQLRLRLAEHEARWDGIEEREADMRDVDGRRRALEAKERGLSAVYEAQKKMERAVEELTVGNAALTEEKEALRAEVESLRREAARWETEAVESKKRVEALEKEREGLVRERDGLQESEEELMEQISLLESKIKENKKMENGVDGDKMRRQKLEREKESLAQENANLIAARNEMLTKIAQLESRIQVLDGEKSDLRRDLEDAISELEHAEAEAMKAEAEAAKERAEAERKASDLARELERRNSEIVQLRANLAEKEAQQRAAAAAVSSSSGARKIPPRSTSKSPGRLRALERRQESETKLREQLGHVASWLDKRGDQGKARGGEHGAASTGSTAEDVSSTAAAAPDRKVEPTAATSEEKEETKEEDVVETSTRLHLEVLKRKLFTAEETLEVTRKELEVVRRRPNVAQDVHVKRVSDLENSVSMLERSLKEERSRAARLEKDLSAARDEATKKEEACFDLRKNLKEAVGLLKPLKEHVAKSEKDMDALRKELDEERMKQMPTTPSMDSASRSVSGGDADVDSKRPRRKTVEELEAELSEAFGLLKEKEDVMLELSEEADRLEEALQETHAELVDVREQLATAAAAAALTKGSDVALASKQATKQSSSEEGDVKLRDERCDPERERGELRELEAEGARLKEMLNEARDKLNDLTGDHAVVSKERNEFKRQLDAAKEGLLELKEIMSDKDDALRQATEQLESALEYAERAEDLKAEVDDLKGQIREYQTELRQREENVKKLQVELIQVKQSIVTITGDNLTSEAAASDLLRVAAAWKVSNDSRIKEIESLRKAVQESNGRVAMLEEELSATKKELKKKDKSQKVLSSSLKEAVGLLKPLQKHVETAEAEKTEMRRKLIAAQRRAEAAENSSSAQSAATGSQAERTTSLEQMLRQVEAEKSELERRVALLEREKIENMERQVPPAADDASWKGGRSVRSEGRQDDARVLKDQLFEMTSRYELTKKLLDEAAETNASLLEDLKQVEKEEEEAVEEVNAMRKRLKQAEEELENAKYIATSALVKVEEMSMKSSSVANGSDFSPHSRRSGVKGDDLMGIAEERQLRSSVKTLQEEVRIAKQKNSALERAIKEKDELLSRYAIGREGGASSTGGMVSSESEGANRSRHSSKVIPTIGNFRQGPRYIG